jgi:hypothetical protein
MNRLYRTLPVANVYLGRGPRAHPRQGGQGSRSAAGAAAGGDPPGLPRHDAPSADAGRRESRRRSSSCGPLCEATTAGAWPGAAAGLDSRSNDGPPGTSLTSGSRLWWAATSPPTCSGTVSPRGSAARGPSLQLVQQLLGHADIRTTTIYSHLVTLGQREAIRQYLEPPAS